MKEYEVEVTQTVKVRLDETKFTPDFLTGFAEGMFPLDGLEGHAKHLAQLTARGMIDDLDPNPFVEGYGLLSEMGIKLGITAQREDINE